jgi:hypothetical protein
VHYIHLDRYHLTEEAPICQGILRGEFGYDALTSAREKVLQGEYQAIPGMQHLVYLPSHCSYMSHDTKINFIQHIITREDWQR